MSHSKKRGETLLESVVSIAVFALIILVVTGILSVATNTLKAAAEARDELFAATQSAEQSMNDGSGTSGDFSFDMDGTKITQEVRVKSGGLGCFEPEQA